MTDKEIPTPIHYHQHVDVRGVVLPTWVAILLSIIGFSASIVVLLSVLIFRESANELAESQDRQTREMRVIILHIQDIENVLIRSRLAKREDFAEWETETQTKGDR